MMHMLNTVPKVNLMKLVTDSTLSLFNNKAWFDLSSCVYSQGKRD